MAAKKYEYYYTLTHIDILTYQGGFFGSFSVLKIVFYVLIRSSTKTIAFAIMAKNKLPADLNKKAKSIVDFATRDKDKETPPVEKNAAAVALGRLGGLKGGKARAESLTATKRSEIAKKAAAARWGKKGN